MSTNRRPESSIAQSFAADLDSMFGLSTGEVPVRSESGENTSGDIEQALNQKKQTLSSKAAELEELEARIKATEERLAKSRNASPARANLPQGQANVGAPFQQQQQQSPTAQRTGHPLAQQPSYPPDRPATQRENTQALMSGMPGHLPPPTPAQEYGREEYVVVDGGAGSGYGRAVR